MNTFKTSLFLATAFLASNAVFAADKKKEESIVDRAPAADGDTVQTGLNGQETRFPLAQVISMEDILLKKFNSGITVHEVLNGSGTSPVTSFVSVFDLESDDGSDLGSFLTFPLVRANGVKLIDKRLIKVGPKEVIVSLAFSTSKVAEDGGSIALPRVVRFRVTVKDGKVAKTATVSIKDK